MIEFINKNLWYIAIPAVIIVGVLWIWSEKRRNKTLKSIISDEMASKLLSSSCSIRRSWRNILFTAAWIVLAFCLLRPYSGVDIEERKQQTRDILVVFDVSNSMNVIDCYGESRLNYGRNLIRKLAANSPSDRFGLMSFSGLAFVEIPLTSDTVSFDIALEGISKHEIPVGGTNIQIALNQALKEFKEGASHKAMILISDGEEIGGDYRDAAKQLKEKNVKLLTVLTGDERKAGTVRNQAGHPLRNRSGDVITSKADTKLLKELAKATEGVFVNFEPNGNSYQQLSALQKEINTIESLDGKNEEIRKPREIYQPFLLIAIVILLVRMFLGERRKDFKKVAVMLVLFTLLSNLSAQQPTPTSPNQLSEEQNSALLNLKHEATKLNQDAKSEEIAEKFRSLAWYNLATNLTRQHEIKPIEPQEPPKEDDKQKMAANPEPPEPGSFARAQEAFDNAIEMAGDQKGIKASALHNKGTLYQKEAQKIFLFEPDQAINYLNEATELFKEALTLNSGDVQTRKNLERSFIDMKFARIAQDIHKLHDEARDSAGKSLFEFRNISKVPLRNPQGTKNILNDSAIVKNNCKSIINKLTEIERTDGHTLYNKVIDHIEKAEAKINDLSKKASEETEKNFAEAYKLLGGNPDQEQSESDNDNSDGDNKNESQDDKNKNESQKNKNNNKSDQKDQQQENKDNEDKNQESDNNDDGKEGNDEEQKRDLDPKNDGFFNKNDQKEPQMSQEEKERRARVQEAEALLRKMSDDEKEVREHIRERQADMIRQEMRRQGIHIPPEANK